MTKPGFKGLKHLLAGLIGISLMQPLSVWAYDSAIVVAMTHHVSSVIRCLPNTSIRSIQEDLGFITLEIPAAQLDTTTRVLDQCPGVSDVYIDPQTTLTLTPVDPYYQANQQWNLSAINAPQAWDLTTGSNAVVVAVIDTGISPTHPLSDFTTTNVLKGARIVNGITSEDTTLAQYSYDGGSHGTAVASLIASQMNAKGIAGLAPGIRLLPVKVFRDANYTGERVSAYNSDIAAGIVWAVNHGADIINLSLGGPSFDTAMQNAVNYAKANGVLVVAASGNDSDNYGTDPNRPDYANVSYPAAYESVIAVGSIDSANQVSGFSNVAGNGIDLSAYGEAIVLPWMDNNGFYALSGTSFSAPTVSAVLALMLSLEPTLSPQAAEAILLGTVTDVLGTDYNAGYDVWTGYGNVNAYRALLGVQEYLTVSDTNSSPETATFLFGYAPFTQQLRPALDEDYYTFTLYEPDSVTVNVAVSDLQDPMLTLYDHLGNVVTTYDEEPNGVGESLVINLSAGTYAVKVTDFTGRSNINDYTIEVRYSSPTLPKITLSDPSGTLENEAVTYGPVTVSILESLAHTISVTRDSTLIDYPTSGEFTQHGEYIVTVTDYFNNAVSVRFTILPSLAVFGITDGSAYNTDRTLTFNASATLNGSPVDSGTVVSAEGTYTLVLSDGLDTATYTFTIDKTAPIITLSPVSETPTNQDITVTANVNEGTLNAESHTFTQNGSFTFTATDLAGNTTSKTVMITTIIKVTHIAIDQSPFVLTALGQQRSLSATLTPFNALEPGITWSSDHPEIVSVDSSGTLTANAIGFATITATAVENGLMATLSVEVALTRHFIYSTSLTGGSLEVILDSSPITSDSDLPINSIVNITAQTTTNYRLYRWVVNDQVLDEKSSTITLTVSINTTVLVEFGLVGDLNLSDAVSATDLVQLRRYLAGLDPVDPKGEFNADLNGDGKVTTTDLVRLRRFLAGLDSLIP